MPKSTRGKVLSLICWHLYSFSGIAFRVLLVRSQPAGSFVRAVGVDRRCGGVIC